MRSALYEWPFTMHLLWEFRCIIDVLLEGIMGLMVAGDFATVLKVESETEVGLIIVLRQRRTRKFAEITQNNSHYVVQGHSRSPILVPIESSYTISY